MHKITTLLILVLIIVIFSMPVFSFAAQIPPEGGLVQCGKGNEAPCTFDDIMDLVNTIINFILGNLVIPIAAIMFAYAGFLLVTAGREAASARTKAKTIFTNTLIGLIIAAACWLIIKTVLSILGYDGAWIGF
ncbi:hypothetical protein A3A01_00160 [Candidatus Nomurabacteria bacterium RIFCSPLOWO2_01_FULL_39_17]|uniref:TrbC/VIRB2 family protein n=1 Tax=Candidatus Nomurabacteria bacterium RIFCSPLOWO2_01_FULL_39_17 TaxID=1801770 RepID=A0A1F6WV49_9BACT|nr:MAG: hypothetical protein A3A01_00160 [Candidatus Nomurabacteria bacterium RIFCSPLOWO2_01_FULL_39_17]